MTHVVFVSTMLTVRRGNLYFLASESVSLGVSVMYLMMELGISNELLIYSRTLGWYALRASMN